MVHGRNLRNRSVVRVPLGPSAVTCVYAFLTGKSQSVYEEFLNSITANCDSLGFNVDPTTIIADFTAKCQSVLANHVPTKLFSQRYSQPWATGKIRNLSRKKKKYYKKAQRTKSDQDMAKYRATKKLVQSECRKAYYQYINSMIGESNQNWGNLKKFWSFIKSKKNDNSGVAPLKKNGIVHSDSHTKVDILNTQFSSVFTKGGKINVPNLGTRKYSVLPDITVCETGVRKLLEAVKPHKTTGPDAIPARLMKDCAAEIAPVLTIIYQASLDQGTVPVD